MPEIPGDPYRGAEAANRSYAHLERFHGVEPLIAHERLHRIKQRAGLGPYDNVVIGRTGDVYDQTGGEYLGSLTYPGE